MNFYQTAPLIRTSIKQSGVFTYESKENIPFGSLAMVNFSNKQVKAVVLEKTTKPFFKTKKIEKVLAKKLLSKKQIILARNISDFYYCAFGLTLKLFIPKITKRIIASAKNNNTITGPSLTSFQEKAVEKIRKSEKNTLLLTGPASSGKTEIIMKLIEERLEKKAQSLIVIPDIFLSYQEIERYEKRFGEKNVALLHSELKASEFHTIWKNIENNKIKIIISTKVGLFCNFKNLHLIAIDEEQDISHKQWDQSPRYHAKQIAQMLGKIHKAKLILMSATPSMESLHEAKNNIVTLPSLKTKNIKVEKPEIISVDLKKYYKKFKRNLVFSREFLKNIENTIERDKLTFILAPQRGKSRYVICKNCKKIISCPQCKTRLIDSGSHYRCLHCNYKISNFSSCPYCRSMQLENTGFGSEKIFSELQKKFPQAKVANIDGNSFKKVGFRKKLFKDIRDNKINVLVGTQTIVKGFDFNDTEMSAVLNKEDFNGNSDFRVNEKILGNLFQLGGRLNRPGSQNQGVFIVQTFEPEDYLIGFLKDWDWIAFSKNELRQRKTLKYPPYTQMIKLIYKGTDQKTVEKNAKRVYNQLLSNEDKNLIEIIPPYFGLIKKEKIFWKKNILLKVIKTEDENLKKIFSGLSCEWIIDINPNNIF